MQYKFYFIMAVFSCLSIPTTCKLKDPAEGAQGLQIRKTFLSSECVLKSTCHSNVGSKLYVERSNYYVTALHNLY